MSLVPWPGGRLPLEGDADSLWRGRLGALELAATHIFFKSSGVGVPRGAKWPRRSSSSAFATAIDGSGPPRSRLDGEAEGQGPPIGGRDLPGAVTGQRTDSQPARSNAAT